MKRKFFRRVAAVLALLAVAWIVIRSLPVTYKGLVLPKPPQVAPDLLMPRPSPAWLIVGEEAVLASFGSSCLPVLIVGMGCGTMPDPRYEPDLAAAVLPADTQAVIVIASTAIKEFHATVYPWTLEPDSASPTIRELKPESERGINKTVFTLEPFNQAGDLVLEVFVYFNQGSASYFWRLNPVEE